MAQFKKYMRLYIVPAYSEEEMEMLETFLTDNSFETFLTDNSFHFSIPTKPPKSIFDEDFKLKTKEEL